MGKCIVQQLQATSFATVTAYQVVCCVCCAAAGATGGVGKRVVQQLLAQGRVVRALVRDVEKAKQLLVSAL
jgi:NADP-dependent 3-hydroxy acid dehydrogenase YdfG